mgnify:CR=1 FL=1
MGAAVGARSSLLVVGVGVRLLCLISVVWCPKALALTVRCCDPPPSLSQALFSLRLTMTSASTVAADLPGAILLAANEGDAQTVTAWLEEGGGGVDTVSCTERGDMRLLMAAALGGQVALVRMLLQRGASVNLQASLGVTALMYAATNGLTTIVQTLLDAKADTSLQTVSGNTAIRIAESYKHTALAQLLRQHGEQRRDHRLKLGEGLGSLRERRHRRTEWECCGRGKWGFKPIF